MDNLQQMLSRQEGLMQQVAVWQDELNQLRQEIAEAACPFKVGDLVQYQKTWGDKELEVYVIERIHPRRWNQPGYGAKNHYSLSGRKLKKDRTPGARHVSIHDHHEPYIQPGETK